MIIYNRLWETMKQKKISQYRLINYFGFSSGQLSRIRNNQNLSTNTINILCNILGCSVENIMEFLPDSDPEQFLKEQELPDKKSSAAEKIVSLNPSDQKRKSTQKKTMKKQPQK